jgi:hypothetical protein
MDVELERLFSLRKGLTNQVRKLRLRTPDAMAELREALPQEPPDQCVNTVIDEGTSVPKDGIEFTVPDDYRAAVPRSLLAAIRRLHINCGHPPNADLERVCRLAGGSVEACM